MFVLGVMSTVAILEVSVDQMEGNPKGHENCQCQFFSARSVA